MADEYLLHGEVGCFLRKPCTDQKTGAGLLRFRSFAVRLHILQKGQASVQTFALMELALARYRLLFKHPFGTAHGTRDGTDCVFVRLSEGAVHGYGEATLPPYLPYDQSAVYQELSTVDLNAFIRSFERSPSFQALSPPSRAALTTAHYDLISKRLDTSISSSLGIAEPRHLDGRSMVTLGLCPIPDISLKLSELPISSLLKVKLGSDHDRATLGRIAELDARPIFLDANQGWDHVDQALEAIAVLGPDRIVGMEQPFGKEQWDLHKDLGARTKIPIYADESIQGLNDLEHAQGVFSGVNLKLMKCGGLDVAKAMVERAKLLGLQVMLGSMSESSLGCAAMYQLSGIADLLDLDGPWLISNDPFEGLVMEAGELHVRSSTGTGVEPAFPTLLNWTTIGA